MQGIRSTSVLCSLAMHLDYSQSASRRPGAISFGLFLCPIVQIIHAVYLSGVVIFRPIVAWAFRVRTIFLVAGTFEALVMPALKRFAEIDIVYVAAAMTLDIALRAIVRHLSSSKSIVQWAGLSASWLTPAVLAHKPIRQLFKAESIGQIFGKLSTPLEHIIDELRRKA